MSEAADDIPSTHLKEPPQDKDVKQDELDDEITYTDFHDESQLKAIQSIIDKELSEPYSIYTYRYFVYNWPELCFFACHGDRYVGVIVCKLERDMESWATQGYIAMLAVEMEYRKKKIGTKLVNMAIETMIDRGATEIVLETELSNKPALSLYESLGFIREKRLLRYYMNGVDALRLKLWVCATPRKSTEESL